MLLTSPLSSPLKNPVRDVFSPAASEGNGAPALPANTIYDTSASAITDSVGSIIEAA